MCPWGPSGWSYRDVVAAGGCDNADAAGVGMSKHPKTEAAAAAVTGDCKMTEKADDKKSKKKKLVEVKLSQEKVDRLLSLPIKNRNRSFPVVTEERLAKIRDPVKREEFRELMARSAKLFYESREQIKREQDLIREEITTLGYAKGVMEVTDEEEEAGDN